MTVTGLRLPRLKLFRCKPAAASTSQISTTEPTKGLLRPEPAAALLRLPRRQKLLQHIWQRTALSQAQFGKLYRAPLERYAALVQEFPASEAHHHAYPGGMLDHGLEIVAYALRLRQSYLLPVGSPPEIQAAQAEAWTAASAYAALLHDIGKIAVDLHVEYADGTPWHPWHGPLARPYRFRYRKDRVYRLHGAATGLLYAEVLQSPILDWMSTLPELWASLLYVLAGQYEHAGILGEIVIRADQASVAQDLGGDPAKAQQAPRESLQRKLLDGLRYLVREKLKLNQREASDGWLTQEGLWLVCKTACDKLRALLLSQGIEGVPSNNTVLFDVLQEHALVSPAADGRAIWTATVTSETGWTHEFSFLKLSPALIWETHERPQPFRGTVQAHNRPDMAPDATLLTTPSLPGIDTPSTQATASAGNRTHVGSIESADTSFALPDSVASAIHPAPSLLAGANAETSLDNDKNPVALESGPERADENSPAASPGLHFVQWLRGAIQTRRLIVNDARALVHTVAGTAYLVSPGIFQRYAQEHPDLALPALPKKITPWEWTQKNFERLRLHKKQDYGTNIWTCGVTGPRKNRRVHGYLLTDGHTIFTDIPPDNPYLNLLPKKAPGPAASA